MSELAWGVKRSLREYLLQTDGTVETQEGALLVGEEIVFPSDDTGSGSFHGVARLKAHGGMLDWVIANPSFDAESGVLEVTDKDGQRVRLAQVSEEGTLLLEGGRELFDQMYEVGTELDPIRMS